MSATVPNYYCSSFPSASASASPFGQILAEETEEKGSESLNGSLVSQ